MPTRISYVDGSLEPVTLDEAKVAARVDDTNAFDDVIPSFIAAAREQAELITGKAWRPQVLRQELADWPAATDVIAVNAATACAVSYWDGSAFVSLSGSAYVFAADGTGTVLAPVLGTSWPSLPERAAGARVRIDLTTGPAAPASVPDSVKLYIMASVAAWLDNPSAHKPGNVQPNPLHERLLDGERIW